jgi:hypothetical protein
MDCAIPGHGSSLSLSPRPITKFLRSFTDYLDEMEHFVPVEWAETVPDDQAINEPGLFRDRNTVCRPKTAMWRTTIDRLQRAFSRYDAV